MTTTPAPGAIRPPHGFSDTQSIAIGVQNNGIVGPDRTGPRNQRRSPLVVNTAFFPKLMWNGRFSAPSGDPFENAQGFKFPLPEGTTAVPAERSDVTHLLVAQAHIPSTELVEMAGFTGTTRNDRAALRSVRRWPWEPGPAARRVAVSATSRYARRSLSASTRRPNTARSSGSSFPRSRAGAPIDFSMFGRAIAEFEFTLVRADAPIDRFARGERNAMTESQKRGALVFFGKGNCVACHAVAGQSNEMFSDFQMHDIGVPQIAPAFGVGKGNVIFDGPGEDEDFGLEQITGDPADRYKFRTSPLRNVGPAAGLLPQRRVHAAGGCDPASSGRGEVGAGLRSGTARASTLICASRLGPIEPVLATLDPLLATPIQLTDREFDDLWPSFATACSTPRRRRSRSAV